MKYLLSLIPSLFVLFCSAQNVGIGTSSPLARLHVADSSVLFSGPASIPSTTTFEPPVSGAGVRMMWYPQKAAFRAGAVTGNIWDKDSIGAGSIAMGYEVKASGANAISIGLFNIASGSGSTSFGVGNESIGDYSTSMGRFNTSLGWVSTSLGKDTWAIGNLSTSIGSGSQAHGLGSLSTGRFTHAMGEYSTSFGNSTIASGNASVVMGLFTNSRNANSLVIGQYNDNSSTTSLFEIGNGISAGVKSNAMTVLLDGKVGIGTIAPEGQLEVKSLSALPQLNLIQASTGDFSRIRLNNGNTDINGRFFDVAGFIGTSASLDRLNFYHFGVGDILTLTGSGNAGLGTTNPSLVSGGKGLHVLNSNYTQLRLESSGSSAGLELDPGGTGRQYEIQADINSNLFVYDRGLNLYRLYMNSSGNLGIGNTNPTQTLTVTGNILASGTITPSDLRLKDHIRPITNALLKLEGLHGVYYEYKVTEHPELPLAKGPQTGVIAQEVEAVLPEAVITDPSGYKMVDYTKLVPLLIESVKSQQELIRLQQEKLDQLLQRIEKLEQDGKRKN